ncbi:efflux RND transporter periplasmic adaptor subunit [Photobacterium sp. WH77]|uniref:efflux RND transporter periplasmic adaptor subunit n=1 Tax=unclassified Photobacterium TaxID=2628852 RepID=UPI001EDA78DB|nr:MULTISPECIES: efflux RND transporter periplasmic adaptor subunit [unclassified Photobacterium]MCG2838470.1 efflux RND transporter periplasmic adaptor subunit [Photobacterium sp. WH77]MCG2846158.1 efflux RND transporter periplasmic adaptor subunit [Photobacterium sp. WH80]
MKTITITVLALLIGSAIGYVGSQYLSSQALSANNSDSSADTPKAPLYWVAPMDPNYRRDQPGKSPMGMDLIPVYEEDQGGSKSKPGTVRIDPAVENNLGVKTAAVSVQPLSPRIETVGYVAFDERHLWQTNVRVSGWVENLYINAVGEQVKQGDVLFTLYSPELVKAQEELLNAYRTKRDGLIKGAYERLVSLGVDKAQIQAIARSGKAVQTVKVKAPADGVIASLNVREGAYLSPAQSVISAGPLNTVWVDAEVFERQAHWIKTGSKATMTLDALPGKAWQGRVDYVYPILDPATRTLRMRLNFNNAAGELKPNMFANIVLEPETDKAVMTIPASAVIRSGGMTRVVLSEGEGKYRSARIEVGRQAAEQIEVLQGLSLQDSVVTSAHFLLDSESSQSADLARINGVEPEQATVWATGEITEVMADHKMLTINHQPVPEWDWPGMVMNFTLAESLEMAPLKTGQTLDFEITKLESGQYQVVDFNVKDQPAAREIWVKGDITMLMADFGMITLSHSAVPEWQWQPGEMNFTVDDSIDLSAFTEGQTVRFLIVRNGSEYSLKQLNAAGGEQ